MEILPGRIPALLASLLLMTACTTAKMPTANPEKPYPPDRPPIVGDILHVPTGHFVSESQMLPVVTDARIVYVGETHDNPASHRLQLTVLRAMAERWPGRVALGMEMFTPAQQSALDAWAEGRLDEKEFLRQARWFQNWQMDFDYYRDLLLFARERQIPVIALNAEKAQVKAVGKTDLAALPEEERGALPEMDLADPYQRAMVEAIFGGHAHGSNGLEGFVRVQTLWDETMAENVARFLQVRDEMRMVVVAGGNHVHYGFGIPRRVFRRLPTSYVLVGSQEVEVPPEKKDRLMNVEMPRFPMPPYDFLVHTRYEDLGKEEVRLGIVLGEEGKGGVRVKETIPGSAAEKAGVLGEDLLLALDGETVRDSFDVLYAVKRKKAGDRMLLRLERQGEVREVDAVMQGSAPPGMHGKR